MAAGTISTSQEDKRVTGRSNPVARIQAAQLSFVTGGGVTADTATVFISGTIVRMDVVLSAVTGNADLTASVTCSDDNGCVFGNELDHANLADASTHYFDSQSSADDDGNFNPVTHHGDITVSVAPDEDVGGTLQKLLVDVLFFVR